MQAFFRKEISGTIDIKSLRNIMPPYCRVTHYDSLRNVQTLREALRGKTVLILLWNIHDKKHRVLNEPGHFFCISTRGPESCVVFSSTGMSPKKELFITQSDPTLLDRILPKGTVYNDKKFQITNSSNTCWRWTILFAHLSKLGLKEFQRLFWKPNLHISDPDVLVVAMTYILIH